MSDVKAIHTNDGFYVWGWKNRSDGFDVEFEAGDGSSYMSRDEAIAAAKAILSHYGISYQVGEEVW